MFRIERNLVNLASSRSIQIDSGDEAAGAGSFPLEAPAKNTFAEQEALRREEAKARMMAEAEAEAKEVVEDARGEAAAIIVAAREQAEEERRKAWQEGYAEGAAEGRRESKEEFTRFKEDCERVKEEYAKKTLEDDEGLKHVISELYDERERTYKGLEDEVVDLALDVVKKVMNPAEEALGGVFVSLIRNALKQIAPEGRVVIRVSPAEYERFFSSGSAIFELDKGVTVTASVLRDASLKEADCIIDTENETVNASLDTQLKYIRIAFNRAGE